MDSFVSINKKKKNQMTPKTFYVIV